MSEQTTDTQTPEAAPPVLTRALNVLGIGVVVGVISVCGTLGLRHFVFELREQKAAFMLVAGSSDEELRALAYDELIDLKQDVYEFSVNAPGMMMPAIDQGDRLDRAMMLKQSS